MQDRGELLAGMVAKPNSLFSWPVCLRMYESHSKENSCSSPSNKLKTDANMTPLDQELTKPVREHAQKIANYASPHQRGKVNATSKVSMTLLNSVQIDEFCKRRDL
jgi:hypothetical protein